MRHRLAPKIPSLTKPRRAGAAPHKAINRIPPEGREHGRRAILIRHRKDPLLRKRTYRRDAVDELEDPLTPQDRNA